MILTLSSTRAGCLLATGYTTSFHLQPVNIRQQILQSWARSYIPPLKQVAIGLPGLLVSAWAKTSPTLGPILGFPRAPVHGKPGKGFEYDFLQLPPGPEPEILETDVVIVGSGCGGAVCAKNLATAGHRVMVVEEGYYWGPEHLPMSEKDGPIHLFANGGVITSDDNSIVLTSGRNWGEEAASTGPHHCRPRLLFEGNGQTQGFHSSRRLSSRTPWTGCVIGWVSLRSMWSTTRTTKS